MEKNTTTEKKADSGNTILDSIRKAREISRPKKFRQTWDFSVSLTGLDLKRPENRINLEFMLPAGLGKERKVAVITDTMAADAKAHADLIITKAELEALATNKKKMKQIAREYDAFLGEVTLMALIGKNMGMILGPRGKIPKPVPPKVKIEPLIQAAKRTVRLSVKDSPVINTIVGTDSMPDEDVAKNAEALLNFLKERLPKGRNNIKSAFIKLTMGKPVKIEV